MRYPPDTHTFAPATEMHACNCIGPQNGDPVCPCQMRGYMERKRGADLLAWVRSMPVGKLRVRVKAGRRVV